MLVVFAQYQSELRKLKIFDQSFGTILHENDADDQHHFHARSCQNFDQNFSVFLVQIDILQEQKKLEKHTISHLKALYRGNF